jgi:diguanylate cyclase (GGDEF)-like protein/PAS domain S-box-containing protein
MALDQRFSAATLLLLAIVLSLCFSALTRWMLRRQLRRLSRAAQALSGWDESKLRAQALAVEGADEVGELIGGFNRMLQKLNQREVFLRQILDTSSVAIFLVDSLGCVRGANQRMADMFASSVTSLEGREYVSLLHPSVRELGKRNMHALLSNAVNVSDLERRYCRDDQTEFWGHLTNRSFVDASGQGRVIVCVINDISEVKKTQVALEDRNQFLRTLLNAIPIPIFQKDVQGRFVDLNDAFLHFYGLRHDDVVGKTASDIHPMEVAELHHAKDLELLDGPGVRVYETVVWDALGKSRDVVLHKASFAGADGSVRGFIGAMIDITERNKANRQLHLAASVFSHAREGITITAADGAIVDVNAAFTRITGYDRDEVLGKNPRILSSGRQDAAFYETMWRDLKDTGHWYGEIWNRRKNGEVYAEMLSISAVHDAQGQLQHYVAMFSDITALKVHEQELEHLAHFDALTGLPNRLLLADRLQQGMTQAHRRGQILALAYLDLDGFKAINDCHGHQTGDQLLIAVAARMKQALREGDTLARLGGDEFVAVLVDLEGVTPSVQMLTRLLTAAAQPVQVGDALLQVSASLGVTFFPQADDVDADQLLRQADQAMYLAKQAGKNRYHVFDAEMDRSVRGHHESVEHIRLALRSREFVLHYQPKVNMRTGAVIGVEALIRWQHPQRGLLPPAEFLPVIEDHPLAIGIGEWVLDSALAQVALWQAAGLTLPVSVNVGARQLQKDNFVQRLGSILAAHPDVSPSSLELEILETSALEDMTHVSSVIEACQKLGVSFALDDFGTGYSSLTYLKRLPVNLLKIDQSFVRGMLDDPNDLAILEGVIGLALAFQRAVIAEGVETAEHGAMLLQLGCELAQGYGIARPMPAHSIAAWAASWRIDPTWSAMATAAPAQLTSAGTA